MQRELSFSGLVRPHDDEDFASVCNRVWRRTGEPSSNRFCKNLLGDENASYYLFRRAPQGLLSMAKVLKMNPVQLILQHTLIPYWESVSPLPLGIDRYQEVLEEDHANARYRLNSWQSQPLQFCTRCVSADI